MRTQAVRGRSVWRLWQGCEPARNEEGSAIVATQLKTDEQQKLASRSARASF